MNTKNSHDRLVIGDRYYLILIYSRNINDVYEKLKSVENPQQIMGFKVGHFGELWIMQLQETEGTIKNSVEYINFEDGAYISWEAQKLPEKKWIPKAEGTIFIEKRSFVKGIIGTQYEELNLTRLKEGLFRKKTKYQIKTTLAGQGELSLLHIVLPKLHIPEDGTFICKPSFVKKQALSVAMTWAFKGVLDIEFIFKKVDNEDLDSYKAVGVPRTIRINQKLLRGMENAVEIATAIAKMVNDAF